MRDFFDERVYNKTMLEIISLHLLQGQCVRFGGEDYRLQPDEISD